METIKEFVIDQALIIIPVLYIIGTIIKGTEKINNKYSYLPNDCHWYYFRSRSIVD